VNVIKVIQLVLQFLPALSWLAAQIQAARDEDGDGGKRATPEEIAGIVEGFSSRLAYEIERIA